MNNPKNALMQKMTDKVMRGGKSPVEQSSIRSSSPPFVPKQTNLRSGKTRWEEDNRTDKTGYTFDENSSDPLERYNRVLHDEVMEDNDIGDQDGNALNVEDKHISQNINLPELVVDSNKKSPTKQNYPSTVRGAKKEIRNNPDATADEIATMGWGVETKKKYKKTAKKYNRLLKSKHYNKSMELRRDAE